LLTYETLEGPEVETIIAGKELDRPKPLETKLVSPENAGLEGDKKKGDKKDVPNKPEPEPGVA
jgi:hypothetical protein